MAEERRDPIQIDQRAERERDQHDQSAQDERRAHPTPAVYLRALRAGGLRFLPARKGRGEESSEHVRRQQQHEQSPHERTRPRGKGD